MSPPSSNIQTNPYALETIAKWKCTTADHYTHPTIWHPATWHRIWCGEHILNVTFHLITLSIELPNPDTNYLVVLHFLRNAISFSLNLLILNSLQF